MGALLDVVHRSDGSLRVIFVRVSNKSEATAAAGVTILDYNLRDEEDSCQPGSMFVRRTKKALEDSGRAWGEMSGAQHTASSTSPNSSNFWRRVVSSVCQARPLLPVSTQNTANVGIAGVAYPMKSFVVEVILIALSLVSMASSASDGC